MTGQRGQGRMRLRSRPGQAVVEFVLIAPLLLLLIFGLVEFARAWNIRHVITDAAREGARIMAVRADADSAEFVVGRAMATAGMNIDDADVQFLTINSPGGQASQVVIEYPYNLRIVGSLLGWAMGDRQLTISTSFTMRNE